MYKKILTLVSVLAMVVLLGCSKESTPTENPQKPYSFASASGNCTGATQSGNFVAGNSLGSNKSISIQVNVAEPGPYSISTDTVNGISFSKQDTFKTAGLQSVALKGNGKPIAVDTHVFTLKGKDDSCKINLETITAGTLTCKLNNVYQDFSSNLWVSLVYNPGANMKVFGYLTTGGNYNFEVWIQHYTLNPLVTGIYPITLQNCYILGEHTDPVFNYWIGDRDNAGQANPFTIIITSVSTGHITGTFSGRIREKAGYGPSYKDVTEGKFDVNL